MGREGIEKLPAALEKIEWGARWGLGGFLNILAQRQEGAMVKGFDGPFTTSHDVANFGVGEVFHKFEGEKFLAVSRQTAHGPEQMFFIFHHFGQELWAIVMDMPMGDVFEGDDFASAVVAVPVGDEVMGNAVEPGRERDPLVFIGRNVLHGPDEDFGGQVFGIVGIANTVVDIVVDAVYVDTIKFAKGVFVGACLFNKLVFVGGIL